jgi:hypothetical protein
MNEREVRMLAAPFHPENQDGKIRETRTKFQKSHELIRIRALCLCLRNPPMFGCLRIIGGGMQPARD